MPALELGLLTPLVIPEGPCARAHARRASPGGADAGAGSDLKAMPSARVPG